MNHCYNDVGLIQKTSWKETVLQLAASCQETVLQLAASWQETVLQLAASFNTFCSIILCAFLLYYLNKTFS